MADAAGLADHQVGRDQAGLQRIGVFLAAAALVAAAGHFDHLARQHQGHRILAHAQHGLRAARRRRPAPRIAAPPLTGPARPACPARPGARASAPAPAPSAGRRGAPGRRGAAVPARRAPAQLYPRAPRTAASPGGSGGRAVAGFAFQPLDASGLRAQQPAAMRLHASVGREQGGMLALQLLAFVGRKTHRVPRRLEEGDGPADGIAPRDIGGIINEN